MPPSGLCRDWLLENQQARCFNTGARHCTIFSCKVACITNEQAQLTGVSSETVAKVLSYRFLEKIPVTTLEIATSPKKEKVQEQLIVMLLKLSAQDVIRLKNILSVITERRIWSQSINHESECTFVSCVLQKEPDTYKK